MEPFDLLKILKSPLESLQLNYLVTGSMATLHEAFRGDVRL